MADHLVPRAHRQALDVPVAHERLPRLRLGEPAVGAQRLDHAGQLGGGRDVGAHDAAGNQRVGDRVDTAPRVEHVEDDPVDPVRAELGQPLLEVPEAEVPRRVGRALRGGEELGDVASRDVGELLAQLEGRDPSPRADRPQQRAGERTRSGARLDDARTREDVGERDDLRGVLRVDHRGAARHRHHELGQQRPEHEVLAAGGGGDGEALVTADQLVVVEVPLVGEEALARDQLEVVPPTLLVGQAHPLALAQRAAVDP